MKTFTALRQIDKGTHALARLQAQLKRQGYHPKRLHPLSGMRYLRFHGQFDDLSELQGLLDIQSWSKATLPALAGIDWLSVEDATLHSLIAEHPLHLALSHQHAPFKSMRVIELVPSVDATHELIGLDATPGAIIVEQFIRHASNDAVDDTTLNHLHIPLTCSIGYSTLPYEAMTTIEVGDVVLIEHVIGRIVSNKKTLFTSEFNEGGIMVVDHAEDENTSSEHTSIAAEGGPALNTLPIELSVVVLEKNVPLSELKAIVPGEMIELPSDAILNVEIRANGRRFARGELVQLPNGQLGVEVRTLWPQE